MILFNKQIGETPKEALDRLRVEQSEYKDSVLSYAGRLDPMAEGVLLVLVDDENKPDARKKFLGLDKQYEVEFLFGVETDTYDALGKITDIKTFDNFSAESEQKEIYNQCKKVLLSCVGKQMQKFPAYSSKTINGVALHEISRKEDSNGKGQIDFLQLPEHEIEIKKVEIIEEPKLINFEIKAEDAIKNIQKVLGDFRQQEIIHLWQKQSQKNTNNSSQLISIKAQIICSSGTYMRTLAHDLGLIIGRGCIAFHIKRTMIYF